MDATLPHDMNDSYPLEGASLLELDMMAQFFSGKELGMEPTLTTARTSTRSEDTQRTHGCSTPDSEEMDVKIESFANDCHAFRKIEEDGEISDEFDEGFLCNGLSSLFGDLGPTPCVPHSGPALKLNYDDIAFTWNQQPSAPEAESRPVPPPQTRAPDVRRAAAKHALASTAPSAAASAPWPLRPASSLSSLALLPPADAPPVRTPAEIAERERDRRMRVERYRQKRRDRAFVKKIRYEVRKLNAEQRPRFKGRFINQKDLVAMENASYAADEAAAHRPEPPCRASAEASRRAQSERARSRAVGRRAQY